MGGGGGGGRKKKSKGKEVNSGVGCLLACFCVYVRLPVFFFFVAFRRREGAQALILYAHVPTLRELEYEGKKNMQEK